MPSVADAGAAAGTVAGVLVGPVSVSAAVISNAGAGCSGSGPDEGVG